MRIDVGRDIYYSLHTEQMMERNVYNYPSNLYVFLCIKHYLGYTLNILLSRIENVRFIKIQLCLYCLQQTWYTSLKKKIKIYFKYKCLCTTI